MIAFKQSQLAASLGVAVLLGFVQVGLAAEPLAAAAPIAVELPPADQQVDFAEDILPLLQRSCLACHSESTAEADVVLETPALLRAAQDDGALVVPSDPAASRLLRVAGHRDEPMMPPPDNEVGAPALTPAELGLLQRWIEQGAKDSQTENLASVNWQPVPDGYRPILATAVTPAGDLAVCSRGNEVYVYGLQPGSHQGKVLTTLIDPTIDPAKVGPRGAADVDLVRAIAVDATANWIATAGFGCVKLWQRDHSPLGFESVLPSMTVSVAAAQDNRLAIAGNDGTIQLFDLSNNKQLHAWKAHEQSVVGLAVVREGTVIVSAAGNIVKAWQASSGVLLASWQLSVPSTRFLMLDDGMLVTASDDLSLRVWSLAIPAEAPSSDTPTQPAALEPQRQLIGHGRMIQAIAAIPGTVKQFLSGGVDGTVRRWNGADGSQVKSWIHGDAVSSIGVAPDGKRFLSIGGDSKVKVWDLSQADPIATLEGDFRQRQLADRLAQAVQVAQENLKDAQNAFEAAKKQLATEQDLNKKALAALDVAKKATVEKTTALAEINAQLDASAKRLAELNEQQTKAEASLTEATRRNADSDKDLELIAAAVKLIQKTEEITAANAALERIRQDRQTYLQSLLRDAQAAVDAQTKERDAAKSNHDALAKQVEVAKKSLDTATAANRDAEATLARAQESIAGSQTLVETANGVVAECQSRLAERESQRNDAVRQAADQKPNFVFASFTVDGNKVLLTSRDGRVFVHDAQSFAPLDAWGGVASPGEVIPVAESDFVVAYPSTDDGGKLARWSSEPKWILKKTVCDDRQESLADRVLSVDFSPDGSLLAVSGGEPSRSGQITIWRVADGSLVRSIPQPHSDTVFDVSFSPDGVYLASASADRTAKIFRTADGELVRTFEGHTDHVTGVSWRANGKQLATSSADHKIKVWNCELGEQQRTIEAGTKEVTAVAFAGSGGLVISSSGDRNVRIHNADDGAAVRTIAGAAGYLFCCATTETGSLVAAGGEDRVLRVWKVADGTELLHIEADK